MQRFILLAFCCLFLPPAQYRVKSACAEENSASEPRLEIPRLQIEIRKDNWGAASREDIWAVCDSASRVLTPYFPGRRLEPIALGYTKGDSPITLFKRGANGEIYVLLNCQDQFWAQFAYQFSHEFCHILCNYREVENPQLWFEEALCETASLFVLRQMADSWKTDPPYPNWKSFAPAFDNYVDDLLSNTAKIKEKSFAEWYRHHRAQLEKNGTNRALNQIVAVKVLLPLLQMNPQHWQALNQLNQWDAQQRPTLSEYLQDWHNRVPEAHRSFVLEIAKKFELELK